MKAKKPSRAKAAPKKRQPRVLSTSEARANFAENLETAKTEAAIIGFDRYGSTVAALVPVEAVYILAGAGAKVPADKRKQIVEEAKLFITAMSSDSAPAAKPAKAAPRRRGR